MLRVPVGTVEDVRDGDVVILAVKSQDTVAALDSLAGRDVTIVCAQNGVANEVEALRRFERVYGVFVWLPAQHVHPGVVQVYCAPVHGVLAVGRFPAGADETAESAGRGVHRGRLPTGWSREDVMRLKRAKLLGNLINGIQVVIGDGAEAERLHELAEAEARRLLRRRRARLRARHSARSASRMSAPRAVHGAGHANSSSWQSLQRGTGTHRDRLPQRRDRAARPPARRPDAGQRRRPEAREPDRSRASRARLARTTRLSGVGGCAGARPWRSRGGRRARWKRSERPSSAAKASSWVQWRRRLHGSAVVPSIVASTSHRRSPSARPAYQPVGADRTWTARPARRPTSAVTAASISGCPARASSAASNHRPATLDAVGVEARVGVQDVGQSRGGDAQIAAGEAEEGEGELVQALVGGVGVDVAEFSRQGEHQVGDRRAATGRQACEAVHFRPTLSGFIR